MTALEQHWLSADAGHFSRVALFWIGLQIYLQSSFRQLIVSIFFKKKKKLLVKFVSLVICFNIFDFVTLIVVIYAEPGWQRYQYRCCQPIIASIYKAAMENQSTIYNQYCEYNNFIVSARQWNAQLIILPLSSNQTKMIKIKKVVVFQVPNKQITINQGK